jgi:hypothetical protein
VKKPRHVCVEVSKRVREPTRTEEDHCSGAHDGLEEDRS